MLIEEVIDFVKRIPPFQFLEEVTLTDISREVLMEFYPKGTIILYQGGPPPEYLYVIKKGEVKVAITNNDEEVFVDYRGEGDLIGYMLIFSNEKSRATVTAVEDTICYLFKRKNIQKLLYTNPNVSEFFHKSFLIKYFDKTFEKIQDKSPIYGCGDRILFTMKVGELATKNVVTASQEISIQEAAQIMSNKKISSLILLDNKGLPSGIITDRDLRDKVVAKGMNTLEPVNKIMSSPKVIADVNEFCFDAVLRMIKHNVHHLLVMKDGRLRGIVTNHDLMVLQGTSPISIVRDIENQNTIEGLIPVSNKINNIAGLLLNEGIKASNFTRIFTEINDRLIKKILEIAKERIGASPLPFCWVVFGSEGRKEQVFKTEQNNALIYEDPSSPKMAEIAHEYFSKLTLFVINALINCGYPLSLNNLVASNPEFCKSFSEWGKYLSNILDKPFLKGESNPAIFFDSRAVYGDSKLLDSLKTFMFSKVKKEKTFFENMAAMAIRNKPPAGLLKASVIDKNGIREDKLDLKSRALNPVIEIVRLFAIEKEIKETSTIERINSLREKHSLVNKYADELLHSFEFIMLLIIKHQFEQSKFQKEINSLIDPDELSGLEKRIAKEIFQFISKLQKIISELYNIKEQ